MNIVHTIHDLDKSEITIKNRNPRVPRYCNYISGDASMNDARDMFKTFTQAEARIFWTMEQMKNIDTNYVVVSKKDFEDVTSYHKVMKSLIQKNVIIRVKNGIYMISPKLTLTTFNKYDDALNNWYFLGGK